MKKTTHNAFLSKINILLLIIIIISGCQEKILDKDEDSNTNTTDFFNITTEKKAYFPFDIVKLIVHTSDSLIEEKYEGKCGNENIIAVKANQSGDTLMFVLPNLIGSQELTLNINGKIAQSNINIYELPAVSNPEEVINKLSTEINNTIQKLDNLSDTLLNAENRLLIGDMVAEFNNLLGQMSVEDKALFARYYNKHLADYKVNEYLSEGEYPLKSTMDMSFNLPQIAKIYTERTYILKQIVFIGTLGYAFNCLLSMPDPTFFTKLAALADGVLLIERVMNLKKRILTLVNSPIIPVTSDQFHYFDTYKSTYRAPAAYDFDIENAGFVYIPHKIAFRTMYAGNIKQGFTPVLNLAQSVGKFQEIWSKGEYLINKVKSIFGFKGKLSGRPQKVENITNFKTIEIVLDEKYIDHGAIKSVSLIETNKLDNIGSNIFSQTSDGHSKVEFSHHSSLHQNGNIPEHYTTFLFVGAYNILYYGDQSYEPHPDGGLFAYSPVYTCRIHCPEHIIPHPSGK